MSAKKRTVQPLNEVQAARAVEIVQGAVLRFRGTVDELESAVGMYMMGHYLGWKVLVLMHSKRTIRKYEDILQIVVREEFPEEGTESNRSIAYTASKKIANFWKAVSGEAKAFDPGDRKLLE